MVNKRQRVVRKTVNKAIIKKRRAGGRVTQADAKSSELVVLRRNDRVLRTEMVYHMHAIGKRAFSLHKRARGDSPFSRFKSIMGHLDTLVLLEDEFRTTRARLARLRKELRRGAQ
jgi:hypothetical protein